MLALTSRFLVVVLPVEESKAAGIIELIGKTETIKALQLGVAKQLCYYPSRVVMMGTKPIRNMLSTIHRIGEHTYRYVHNMYVPTWTPTTQPLFQAS